MFFLHKSPFDCFGDFVNPTTCSNFNTCKIFFKKNLYSVPRCNKRANYYYVQYQCIPSKFNQKPLREFKFFKIYLNIFS
jgi:hypothetical protein